MMKMFVVLALAGAAAVPVPAAAAAKEAAPEITVYKTPTCGCCTKWEDHLKANGFQVTSKVMKDVSPIKKKHQVPQELQSCHTGVVGKYVVEGHVPASTIKRLLKEKPANTVGISVPGMPIGSPGMEVADQKDPYAVVRFDSKGKTEVYERH